MAEDRQLFHLQVFNFSGGEDTHSYYGSMKALCNQNPKEVIGVQYASLRNAFMNDANIYKNSRCIIRKGILKTVETQRGKYQRNKLKDM